MESQIWLSTLIRLDPESGVSELERRFKEVAPSQYGEPVKCLAKLYGNRHGGIGLGDPRYTPDILFQMLRMAYHHIQPSEDLQHVGTFSPDVRDDAQHARNLIVNTMLELKGEAGWATKLKMAAEPMCAHFKDRIIALAEEQWANEIDAEVFSQEHTAEFNKTGKALPATNEAMFNVMVDRIGELDELLLQDTSPREAWAGIKDERVMRREIARELKNSSIGQYKVDQEAATADEKETDIRLRSTISSHEAVIELKLADERSARDLRDTLKQQLVNKYMAAETSRSGCLLITIAKDRNWDHPDSGKKIDLHELIQILRAEADNIMVSMGQTLRLNVHVLDLRPRLPKAKN